MKNKVIKKYIEALEQRLAEAKASYEVAKKDSIEAEGRMVTRYDSTKTETSWLADGYLETVKTLQRAIKNLKQQVPYVNLGDHVLIDIFKNESYDKREEVVVSRENLQWNSAIHKLLGKEREDIVLVKVRNQNYGYQIRELWKNERQNNSAKLGDLVTLEDEYGEKECYYLVPEVGGVKICIDGTNIFCISSQAPLTQMIVEKKVDEIFEINAESYRIAKIQ